MRVTTRKSASVRGPGFLTGSMPPKSKTAAPLGCFAAYAVLEFLSLQETVPPVGQFFWMSRSVRSSRFSLRSRRSSARSAVVKRPVPLPARSIESWATHVRTAVSDKSRSRQIARILLPLVRIMSTTSALNAGVKCRRGRLAMGTPRGIVASAEVSTKSGQDQPRQAKRGKSVSHRRGLSWRRLGVKVRGIRNLAFGPMSMYKGSDQAGKMEIYLRLRIARRDVG